MIKRRGVLRVREGVEVVDIASNDDSILAWAIGSLDSAIAIEHTWIGLALGEALFGVKQPREDGTLPTSTRLGHAVAWFYNHAGMTRLAIFVSRWRGTINHFIRKQLTLKIGSDKIPAVHM